MSSLPKLRMEELRRLNLTYDPLIIDESDWTNTALDEDEDWQDAAALPRSMKPLASCRRTKR
jgi:hypothetical protein